MRVVVLPSWYPTGDLPYAGGFIRSSALALAEQGLDVTVMFPELRSLLAWRPGAGSGDLSERPDGPMREWRWRGFRWWPRERHGTIAFTSAARRLMADFVAEHGQPDLVHAHVVLPAGAAARKLAEIWDIPFVLTEHAGPFSMMTATAWQRWGTRAAIADASAVTAVSPALVRAMRDQGVTRDISVIPNTLDPLFAETAERIAADSAGPSAHVIRSHEAPRFLAVSALERGKGLDVLLRAMAELRDPLPAATLTIAGSGPAGAWLRPMADGLGVRDRVKFIGALAGPAAVRSAMLESDVFVLPSRSETFGVTLIEALACGRPVVATRCGGPESIVTPECGALTPVDDPLALARAMRDVAANLRSFPPAALARDCLARFGPKVVGRQYVEVFQQALGRTCAAAEPG